MNVWANHVIRKIYKTTIYHFPWSKLPYLLLVFFVYPPAAAVVDHVNLIFPPIAGLNFART